MRLGHNKRGQTPIHNPLCRLTLDPSGTADTTSPFAPINASSSSPSCSSSGTRRAPRRSKRRAQANACRYNKSSVNEPRRGTEQLTTAMDHRHVTNGRKHEGSLTKSRHCSMVSRVDSWKVAARVWTMKTRMCFLKPGTFSIKDGMSPSAHVCQSTSTAKKRGKTLKKTHGGLHIFTRRDRTLGFGVVSSDAKDPACAWFSPCPAEAGGRTSFQMPLGSTNANCG